MDPGKSTNRTVYTFVGTADAVVEAAFAAAKTAYDLIDMTKQTGEHPRLGALDVCPFIPISNASMEDCVECAKRFSKRLAEELSVPGRFVRWKMRFSDWLFDWLTGRKNLSGLFVGSIDWLIDWFRCGCLPLFSVLVWICFFRWLSPSSAANSSWRVWRLIREGMVARNDHFLE